jgi:hypothetical protein
MDCIKQITAAIKHTNPTIKISFPTQIANVQESVNHHLKFKPCYNTVTSILRKGISRVFLSGPNVTNSKEEYHHLGLTPCLTAEVYQHSGLLFNPKVEALRPSGTSL